MSALKFGSDKALEVLLKNLKKEYLHAPVDGLAARIELYENIREARRAGCRLGAIRGVSYQSHRKET